MILTVALTLVIALMLMFCVLALMDQYRTLELVRERLGIKDQPSPVDRPATVPSLESLGLSHLLPRGAAKLVLFLTTNCGSCHSIAAELSKVAWGPLVVVVGSSNHGDFESWCTKVGLPPEMVHFDEDGMVSHAFLVSVSPSVFLLHDDQVVLAQTVPSFRHLRPLLDGSGIKSAISTLTASGSGDS